MNKQDLYALCTLIPPMDDYSGHNMYLCGKRDGFNECGTFKTYGTTL